MKFQSYTMRSQIRMQRPKRFVFLNAAPACCTVAKSDLESVDCDESSLELRLTLAKSPEHDTLLVTRSQAQHSCGGTRNQWRYIMSNSKINSLAFKITIALKKKNKQKIPPVSEIFQYQGYLKKGWIYNGIYFQFLLHNVINNARKWFFLCYCDGLLPIAVEKSRAGRPPV